MAGYEDVAAIAARLQAIGPAIQSVCQISGNAALSIGVMRAGKVIHRANFGFRDVDAKIPPDSDTVYHMASLSKVAVAASVAHLVHESKFGWETPLRDIFPEFKSESHEFQDKGNMIDVLAHRTALASKNAYMTMGHQIHLVPKAQTWQVISILEPAAVFRKDFRYNNWMYGLAGNIVEQMSGVSLNSYTKTKFFDPLGLKNTTFDVVEGENYAKSYVTLDDGTAFHIPRPSTTDKTSLDGTQGLKSTVNDLLIYFGALLEASNDQARTKFSSTPGNPFVEAQTITSPHMPVSDVPQPQTYGLGLVLTTVPGVLGIIGTNGRDLGKDTPVAARSAKGNRVWYHNGSMAGGYTSVHILPDEETVLVVLSNTMALTDVPDFVGQMLIEAILDEPSPNDYVALATQATETHLKRYPEMRELMKKQQKLETPMKPLEQYVGRYFNCIGNFWIDISSNGTGLTMTFQSIPQVSLALTHYEYDVFARPDVHRDDDMKACMFPSWKPAKQKICFSTNDDGVVDRLSWHHDSYLTEAEVFFKNGITPVANVGLQKLPQL